MKSNKGTDTKSSISSAADVTAQSDMKEVIKIVLLRVANKTTSRYGVALFLFCSSMWLLTQAFLALQNGCWISNPQIISNPKSISNPQIISKIKEKTSADCRMSPNLAGIQKENGERDPDGLHHLLSQQKGDKGVERAVFNALVERKVAAAPAKLPVNMVERDTRSVEVKESSNVPDNGQEKRSEDKSESDQNVVELKNKKTISQMDGPRKNSVSTDKVVGSERNTQVVKTHNGTMRKQSDKAPTLRPYMPLPQGSGVPALKPVPYTLPRNVSKDVIKVTKGSWETMGCINRVTIFAPGVNALSNDIEWQELYQSFRKYRMGYYLLKCPDNVCDIILRAAASAKTIAGGSAVLVGPGTKAIRNKTLEVMEEVKRLTPDDLLKIYLFSLDSSPMMNYYDPSLANFEYHYSMTYHSQSNVPIPYGRYRGRVGAESARNWAKGKKGLVAWVEDNCHRTFWPRIEYVRELSKHISVDIYGKCGNKTCMSTHCKEELKGYKFYLALEEAACDEFITLNFWQRALLSGAVPVVYGGKKFTYTKVAPPDSFIHIADYESPAALASYLRKLSASDLEYNTFHHWRTLGSVEVSGPGFSLDSLCGMVPQLIHFSPPKRRVMSRGKFYRSCRRGIYVNGLAGSGDLSNWTPWR